jgi:hypothetical protein
MRYIGKLYGKLANKYFDTGKTSDDYDELEKQVERLKGIVSGKTFHDETEVLKLQVKDLEAHNEEIRNDYKIAIKILRLKYSDDEISTMWAEINNNAPTYL